MNKYTFGLWVMGLILLIGCKEPQQKQEKFGEDEYFLQKKLKNVYEFVSENKIVGFAKQYEWETPNGEVRNMYDIVDPFQQPVGLVMHNGLVLRYVKSPLKGKWEKIGNLELARAAQILFDLPEEVQVKEVEKPE